MSEPTPNDQETLLAMTEVSYLSTAVSEWLVNIAGLMQVRAVMEQLFFPTTELQYIQMIIQTKVAS